MGELLARNEIFLFAANLLQKLRFDPPEDHPAPSKQNYTANFTNIPRDGLIEIIPQLIARLDHENLKYKDLMKDIIIYIGREHPQTLLFPLIYMKKGYKSKRTNGSLRVMESGIRIDPKR